MLEYPFVLAEGECILRVMSCEEFKGLAGDYPHKRNLYRSMTPALYCKVDFFETCIQGVMRIPGKAKRTEGVHAFGFYIKDREVMLIEDGGYTKLLVKKIQETINYVGSTRHLLLYLFEAMVEEDMIYLAQQEEKLAQMEEGLLHHLPEYFHEKVIAYRRQFQMYHVYYEQLIQIGEQMQGQQGCKNDSKEMISWQLYERRVQRLLDYVGVLREYLIQIRELYQSLMDERQNKVMSILTVVTTIFLPLSLIAGWYGMNFPGMPEFQWEYAYPVVILVSIGIIVLEILFFRKKKML